MKYIISNYGLGIAVGLVGEEAEMDATLAENLYDCNHSDMLFDRLMYMPSLKSFKNLLIMKEYFKIWDEHWTRNKISGSNKAPNIMQFTRRAIRRAKLVLESNVSFENFMYNYSANNQTYSLTEA
jgi:hypothetical protein